MAPSTRSKDQRPFFDVHPEAPRRLFSRVFSRLKRARQTVNLKPNVIRRYPLASAVALVLIVLSIFGLNSIFTKAEVADFYPATCLGDWQEPSRAQGQPELLNAAFASSGFSNDNSAVYTGGNAKIYCGGFVPADFETKGTLTSVGLTLVWQIGDTPPSSGEIIVSTSTASSTTTSTVSSTDIGAPTSSELTPVAATSSTSTDGALPPPAGSSEIPASSTDAAPTSSDTSTSSFLPLRGFFAFFAPRALAQDVSSDTVSTPPAAPVPPSTTESTPSVVPPSETSSSASSTESSTVIILGPPIGAVLASTTASTTLTTETLASTSTAPTSTAALTPGPPPPDQHFLKISYSLDGQSWFLLATVGIDDWQRLTVTIPVANWQDLKRLQISIEGIPTTLQRLPKVYLDGLVVEAHYKLPPLFGTDSTQPLEPGTLPLIDVSADRRPTPVERASGEFGANETPAFDIDLNSLPLPVAPTSTASSTVSSADIGTTTSSETAPLAQTSSASTVPDAASSSTSTSSTPPAP